MSPGDSGVVVTAFESDYLVELFELREALETQVARLAARRRNETVFAVLRRDFDQFLSQHDTGAGIAHAFYQLIERFDEATDDAAANTFLTEELRTVRGHLTRLRNVNPHIPRFHEAAREQVRILDAIIDRDEVLAMQQTAVHLRASLRSVLSRTGVHSLWREIE
ncbi:MAG: GntR family transcriptional regulator [Rhodoglobus sp.]